ncbi:MAG TPA: methyltransferase domain-containing protein [Jatrophihabitans sp.]|nr:methyltransferase domain-containing protein [Jatrophihabitans sp.]
MTAPSTALTLTGERTLPGIAEENYWFRRHQAAYEFLAGLIQAGTIGSGRLLEVGAGEGYGAALLAELVPVCALDYDPAAVAHLADRYPGLLPVRANLAALPVADAALATVVALQVIEHVWDHRQFLAECARVLRPGGWLVLSTPNRLTFSPGAGAADRPINPFHTHEFTAAELAGLVRSAGFAEPLLYGLAAGPRLAELDRRHAGFVPAQLAVPAEDWTERLRADVDSVRTADFVLTGPGPAEELDDCLDLILLARSA